MGRPAVNSNQYTDIVGTGITLIETRKGDCILIDTADRPIAERHSWTTHSHRYAYAGIGRGKDQKKVYLHRLLCKTADGKQKVDHINAIRQDCRSENLRACTNSQNNLNQSLRTNNTTGFKGVSRDSRSGKFLVRIFDGFKYRHCGVFASIDEASKVATAFREKHHGEFARHE
jgi:hypothetical protein